MSPEFEAAAKELEGKVRFVKLDTDQNEIMANKLAINGLPTLLFLDKFVPVWTSLDRFIIVLIEFL